MGPPRRHADELRVRDVALGYPETHEDFPWGHRAIKVRRKVFVVMSNAEPDLRVSVKLPWSAEGVLQLPNCAPTEYGLGRSGWVTATYSPRQRAPLDALRSWIDESYRAIAPKRLVATIGSTAGAGAARPAKGTRRPRSRSRSARSSERERT